MPEPPSCHTEAMATIVQNINDGKNYVLLGSGYGAFRATAPSAFFGNLAPQTNKGELPLVLVTNASGETAWMYSNAIRVISVDGQSPASALASVADAQDKRGTA